MSATFISDVPSQRSSSETVSKIDHASHITTCMTFSCALWSAVDLRVHLDSCEVPRLKAATPRE